MTENPRLALSVRAPWWWAILHCGKDIENRDWKPGNPARRFRGRCWLHASSWFDAEDVRDDWDTVCDLRPRPFDWTPHGNLTLGKLKEAGGHIVGSVEVADLVTESSSRWFFGPLGLVLRNPIALPTPVRCKGALGFFEPAPEVTAQLQQKVAA